MVHQHDGKIHEYLGMEIGYTKKGKVKFRMISYEYVVRMIEKFREKLKSTDTDDKKPAGKGLSNQGQGQKLLPQERAEASRAMIAKGLFLCKRTKEDLIYSQQLL